MMIEAQNCHNLVLLSNLLPRVRFFYTIFVIEHY